MGRLENKLGRLKARKNRIRKKVSGSKERPRVSVRFSNRNIFAQMIDDEAGKTLASVSTLEKGAPATGKNAGAAKKLGQTLAERAKEAGVTKVVFDRNGRRYHGKVKEFADALKEQGIGI